MSRIYAVVDNQTLAPRLVRAYSRAAAVSHVARLSFTVSVASQEDLVAALGKGVQVEEAGLLGAAPDELEPEE